MQSLIDGIDYKHVYFPKKYKKDKRLSMIYSKECSSNLDGFILVNREEPSDIGVLSIRRDACVLLDDENKGFVTFEDIGMAMFGDVITYIDIIPQDTINV